MQFPTWQVPGMAPGGGVMVLVTLSVTVVTASCPARPSESDVVGAGTGRFAFGYGMFALFEPYPSGFEGHNSITAQQDKSNRSKNTQSPETLQTIDMASTNECDRSVLVKLRWLQRREVHLKESR